MRKTTEMMIVKIAKRLMVTDIIAKSNTEMGKEIVKLRAKKTASMMAELIARANEENIPIEKLTLAINTAKGMLS